MRVYEGKRKAAWVTPGLRPERLYNLSLLVEHSDMSILLRVAGGLHGYCSNAAAFFHVTVSVEHSLKLEVWLRGRVPT